MTEQIVHNTPFQPPVWFHDQMFNGCTSLGPAAKHLAKISRAIAGLDGISQALRISQILRGEDGASTLPPGMAESLYCAQAALIEDVEGSLEEVAASLERIAGELKVS